MSNENGRILCPCPRELAQVLKAQEDSKEQKNIVGTLDLAFKGWNSDDVEDMLDNGHGEEDFRHICFVAMKFQHVELFSFLTKLEIAPYALYESNDADTWRKFQEEIMLIGNPRIITASLRFFRTGEEGFEYLWKPFIPLLLRLVEDQSVCDNIRELGSITRIVWNCSEANERPGNLTNLLLRTWRSFMDKMEDERSTCLEDNLAASLRFFRTGEEGFEHLWKPFIPLLLRLVEDQSVCDNIRELGSITRIVWNCSEANERPGNLTNLLLRTWRSFMDKMEDERSTCLEDNSVRLQRVELYHSALVSCGGKPFRNEEEWTEHAVRNLLIESLANGLASQINHKNPTRGFCRELGIDFAAFDKLL
eukprot:TRINITY_DN12954_c0_g1_i1.p1 TRINITY_DN12954_c0_g1~~TRINITY_DN12954_c0_g1_i1.p1  ORF type:complete len:364 (+),score=87.43 TRINITY_DN12954_c0_g1_i1:47-1138(+)